MEGLADEPCAVGVFYQPAGGRDRSRHAYADAASLPRFLLKRVDEIADRAQRRAIVAARCRHAKPRAFAPILRQRHAFDLGASEVDADAHEARLEIILVEPGMNEIMRGLPVGGVEMAVG